jgi:ParB-like chromosome segregation protein Spo0J
MTLAPPSVEIRYLPLHKLKEAPYNPRRVLPETSPVYQRLRQSLLRFGLVEPLIWNETTGHIVGGHFRLRILRELGVDVVPVSVVRLTPEQEKALNIVLNNPQVQSRFDPKRLVAVLRELAPLPELEWTGFTAATLRELDWQPQPLAVESTADDDQNEIEVTLQIPCSHWHQVESELDALIRRYDLRCHVLPAGVRSGLSAVDEGRKQTAPAPAPAESG